MELPVYLQPFYEEGKQSYKEGVHGEDCPYTIPLLVKAWMKGWQEMFTEEMAFEDLETDYESCYDPFEWREPDYWWRW